MLEARSIKVLGYSPRAHMVPYGDDPIGYLARLGPDVVRGALGVAGKVGIEEDVLHRGILRATEGIVRKCVGKRRRKNEKTRC